MLSTSILSTLLLVASVSAQVSTKSFVTCLTKQDTRSATPIQTKSRVLTLPWYAYKIVVSTPSTTITPAASTTVLSTTTTISSTTTLPVETDTSTSTSSVISTIFATTTTTTTSTSAALTTIYTTDTTTIAASAGFIPIETSVPNSMKRDVVDLANRDHEGEPELEERAPAGLMKLTAQNGKPVCNPAVYPQSVECVGVVAVITTIVKTKSAAKTTTIVAKAPTVTSTTTFTTSTTITQVPPRAVVTQVVTMTISTTSTTTETATVNTVTTDTVTVAAPQATFYAACADNNIISSINEQGISSAYVANNVGQSFTGAASAYECCVACLQTAGCGAAAYFNGGSTCDLISLIGGTCTQSNQVIFIAGGSSASFSFSNGYCGVAKAS